jgi:CRP-like cAMP-binding protein
MAKTLADLWSEALTTYENEEWDRSLRRCIVVLQGAPACFEARMKVGDILLKQGMIDKAIKIYKQVAWHFTKAGYPLLGIVAVKMLAALEDRHNDVLEILAHLYSSESDRVAADAPQPQLPRLEALEVTAAGENIDQVIPLSGHELAKVAIDLAENEKGLDEYPKKLPAIPLFSDLPEEAFLEVLNALKLHRYAGDGLVLREGEPGHSVYLLARGQVEVFTRVNKKRKVLAQLSDGVVFGEMALIANVPRTASVRAVTHVDMLELTREDLYQEADKLESVAKTLKKFTRSRLLKNLLNKSAIFKDIPQDVRREIMDKFIAMETKKGQVLVKEGQPGIGLFLILAGDAEVKKQDGDSTIPIALLKEGDIFGEISLIKNVDATATVIAGHDGEVLFISAKDFKQIVRKTPKLWQILDEMSDERIKESKRLINETDLIDDSDIILI